MRSLFTWLKNRRGATMIEYALLASLISIVAITAITNTGTAVNAKFETVSNALK